nr:MAG TPA: hypothetical protein [Caudoviricetes sp.]
MDRFRAPGSRRSWSPWPPPWSCCRPAAVCPAAGPRVPPRQRSARRSGRRLSPRCAPDAPNHLNRTSACCSPRSPVSCASARPRNVPGHAPAGAPASPRAPSPTATASHQCCERSRTSSTTRGCPDGAMDSCTGTRPRGGSGPGSGGPPPQGGPAPSPSVPRPPPRGGPPPHPRGASHRG